MIRLESTTPNETRQTVRVRTHELSADMLPESGGKDEGPDPHDYFDAALAGCKNLTALWYAKRNGIPLERVEIDVERDASEERKGKYVLKVRQTFHGPLTDEQREKLHQVVERCPIHKLMATTDVVIEAVR